MDVDELAASAVVVHHRLTRVVFVICGDRALAEDCAQEALVRAWERVDRGDDLRSLEAWTTRVAINACRSKLRRRSAERRAIDRLPPGREAMADATGSALSADVSAGVLALPLRQREVVVLHYLLDQDVATIADTLSISTGAVKNALFHARASLAVRLGHRAPEATTDEPVEERS